MYMSLAERLMLHNVFTSSTVVSECLFNTNAVFLNGPISVFSARFSNSFALKYVARELHWSCLSHFVYIATGIQPYLTASP